MYHTRVVNTYTLPVAMLVTPHLVSGELNIDVGHILSDMDPNGGSPWDGNRAPGLLNTFVDFLRFFHFALRF